MTDIFVAARALERVRECGGLMVLFRRKGSLLKVDNLRTGGSRMSWCRWHRVEGSPAGVAAAATLPQLPVDSKSVSMTETIKYPLAQ